MFKTNASRLFPLLALAAACGSSNAQQQQPDPTASAASPPAPHAPGHTSAPVSAPAPEKTGTTRQAFSCGNNCGDPLTTTSMPGPNGATDFTAYSNGDSMGTGNDCSTAGDDCSTHTEPNGVVAYGCAWQCVELVNRYFASVWGGHELFANAGPDFCAAAASSSLPEYYVYGYDGASASGAAPVAGDALVFSGHVALVTSNTGAPGSAGTINTLEQNATCSGTNSTSWDGSFFAAEYGENPLCWIHVQANSGAPPVGPPGQATSVSATAEGGGEVIVTWTPPSDDGGSPISVYAVYAYPQGQMYETTDSASIIIDGLPANTDEIFTVTAYNGNSWGSWSDWSNWVTVQ